MDSFEELLSDIGFALVDNNSRADLHRFVAERTCQIQVDISHLFDEVYDEVREFYNTVYLAGVLDGYRVSRARRHASGREEALISKLAEAMERFLETAP